MFRLANALPSFRAVSSNSGPDSHAVATGEEEDQVTPLSTPLVSRANDATPIQSIPPWVRELNNSRVTRQSRSSSIVSTQTKFTTTTLHEDARSIDINVGGQYFRISRDGSRVTADAPPPYTGPGEVVRFRGGRAADAASINSQTDADDDDDDDEDQEDEEENTNDDADDGETTPRSTFVPVDTEHRVGANILDPTDLEMPSPAEYERLNHRSSTTTLVPRHEPHISQAERRAQSSFEQGSDVLSTPARHGLGRRAASQDITSSLRHSRLPTSPLNRTNGIRLPRLITSSDIPRATQRPQRFRDVSSPGHLLQIHSADARLDDAPISREPRSPDYIGRNARGAFPFARRVGGAPMADDSREALNSAHNTPLAMDDENDISLHYARMMRTLDAAHRQAVHLKDKQISELREKLNEKDIVLRQQLRAKDFIIDDLKIRLCAREESVETLLEKARNQVEDLWESRWKHRDFHLRERMRRMEEDALRTVDRPGGEQDLSEAGPLSPS